MSVPPFLDNHDGPDEAILLTRFFRPWRAQFFRQLLESQGIPSWIGGENMSVWGSYYTSAGFFILPEDHDRALELLREFLVSEEEAGVDEEDEEGQNQEETGPEDISWAQVARFESVNEADVFVGALKSMGIPSAMDVHRGRRFEKGWAMVSVPPSRLNEALRFLETSLQGIDIGLNGTADANDAVNEEDGLAPAVTCPNCGSANVVGKMPPIDGLAGLLFGAFLLVWNVFLFVMGVIFKDLKRNDHYCRDCGWSW